MGPLGSPARLPLRCLADAHPYTKERLHVRDDHGRESTLTRRKYFAGVLGGVVLAVREAVTKVVLEYCKWVKALIRVYRDSRHVCGSSDVGCHDF